MLGSIIFCIEDRDLRCAAQRLELYAVLVGWLTHAACMDLISVASDRVATVIRRLSDELVCGQACMCCGFERGQGWPDEEDSRHLEVSHDAMIRCLSVMGVAALASLAMC